MWDTPSPRACFHELPDYYRQRWAARAYAARPRQASEASTWKGPSFPNLQSSHDRRALTGALMRLLRPHLEFEWKRRILCFPRQNTCSYPSQIFFLLSQSPSPMAWFRHSQFRLQFRSWRLGGKIGMGGDRGVFDCHIFRYCFVVFRMNNAAII